MKSEVRQQTWEAFYGITWAYRLSMMLAELLLRIDE